MKNEEKANEIIDSNYYVTIAEKNAATMRLCKWLLGKSNN